MSTPAPRPVSLPLKRHEPDSPESIYLRECAARTPGRAPPPRTPDRETLDALPF